MDFLMEFENLTECAFSLMDSLENRIFLSCLRMKYQHGATYYLKRNYYRKKWFKGNTGAFMVGYRGMEDKTVIGNR